MQCRKRCRTQAGESAHLFRVHGLVAQERAWITSTTCDACLKEYHTFDKLQVHLRHATHCRAILYARPPCPVLAPGFGSTVNNVLREQHDGLLPVQQGHGPLNVALPPRDIDLHHGPLFEALTLAILDHTDPDPSALESTLREIIPGFAIGWTKLCDTLRFLAESLTEDFVHELHLTRIQLYDVLDTLGDPLS